MTGNARLRVLVVTSAVVASGLFLFELPIRQILHQRGQIAVVAGDLASINAQNRTLKATIISLNEKAVVGAIADADYGLVFKGQQSYVVLPGAHNVAGAANTLQSSHIPTADFVPGDASSLTETGSAPAAGAKAPPQASVIRRTIARLEFWRWAF